MFKLFLANTWKEKFCPGIILNALSSSAAAAAKLLQSCSTLRDLMDCSLPGSSVHGSFQARVLGWGAIAFSVSSSAAAKWLQSCPTLCDPIDSSPPGSPIPGILQARIMEWVAISFYRLVVLEQIFLGDGRRFLSRQWHLWIETVLYLSLKYVFILLYCTA